MSETQNAIQTRQDAPGSTIATDAQSVSPKPARVAPAGSGRKNGGMTEPALKWCPGDWCRGPQPVDTFRRGLCLICRRTRACKSPTCERKGKILNPSQFRPRRAICWRCEYKIQGERRKARAAADPAWVKRASAKKREWEARKRAADPAYVAARRASALAYYRRQARNHAYHTARQAKLREKYWSDPERRAKRLAYSRAWKAAHPSAPARPCSGLNREGQPCRLTTHDPSRLCRYHRRKAEQAA